MNEQISSLLKVIENLGIVIEKTANKPAERYNQIIREYDMDTERGILGKNFLMPLQFGAAATVLTTKVAPLASAGTTALTTTGTTAGTTALATVGTTAAGGLAVFPVALAAITAAAAGVGIGKIAVNFLKLNDGKRALEELQTNVRNSKKHCESMTSQLNASVKNIDSAIDLVNQAKKDLSNQKYPKKEANIKRINKRYNELVSIKAAISVLNSKISIVYSGLCNMD